MNLAKPHQHQSITNRRSILLFLWIFCNFCRGVVSNPFYTFPNYTACFHPNHRWDLYVLAPLPYGMKEGVVVSDGTQITSCELNGTKVISTAKKQIASKLVKKSGIAIMAGSSPNYYHNMVNFMEAVQMLYTFKDDLHAAVLIEMQAGKMSRFLPAAASYFGVELIDVPATFVAQDTLSCWETVVAYRKGTDIFPPPNLVRKIVFSHFLNTTFDITHTPKFPLTVTVLLRPEYRRGWLNTDDVKELLGSNFSNQTTQFRFVRFDNVSIQYQLEVMASTDILVGPHGAGLTNLIFLPPSSCVVEVFPKHILDTCYLRLCEYIGLHYVQNLDGTSPAIDQQTQEQAIEKCPNPAACRFSKDCNKFFFTSGFLHIAQLQRAIAHCPLLSD